MTKRKPYDIPLFDLTVSPQARREVADTLKSGWLTTGPKVAAFEKGVAEYLRVRHACAVNSCSIGLQLALKALGIGRDQEVITSPFTFVATAEAILAAGATPVFADINPDTLNIDPDEVERKLGSRTAAVMPIDIAGYPADYDRLNEFCSRHELPLIADAAHSFGTQIGSRSVAALSDMAVYSFHSTKNLTCGEGGMVLSRHKILIDIVRTLARHGLSSDAHKRRSKGEYRYDAHGLGLKANMSDVHAAIGLGQLTTIEKNQDRREKLARRYLKNLGDLRDYLKLPESEPPLHHGWHLFIVRLRLSRLGIDRHKFIREMAAQGIECGVHFRPIFELSYYREKMGLSGQYFPNSTYAGQRVVTLPLYPELKLAQVDRVCEAVRSILTKKRRRR
jgi:dTDP-4-amino-4,6-dideoxygalactose transaminase